MLCECIMYGLYCSCVVSILGEVGTGNNLNHKHNRVNYRDVDVFDFLHGGPKRCIHFVISVI